jgi:DNA-binding response OmpR family regulator
MKASKKKKNNKVLVLEPDEQLSGSIRDALESAVPGILVEMSRTLEEAQRLVLGVKPDLFVLDVDATADLGQDFLFDLRTSHPDARAIILTGAHLPAQREEASALGGIHFLEKPFPHSDFVDLVHKLLQPETEVEREKFQGTLSDLHVADIIQLKCLSGANAVVEFTGPRGEKGRVFFENGQVIHATAPGREGLAAFNEIVTWKGGTISEMSGAPGGPRTIDRGWQMLLMEATRKMDERGAAGERARAGHPGTTRRVLVTDDSLMLLSFVQEVLIDAKFDVTTAATGAECLNMAGSSPPDLILLDYVLPDMKGDEVCRQLLENERTARVPVVYMSGIVADLRPEVMANPNVIGFLNKPFTSDLLIQTVESHMSKSPEQPEPQPESPAVTPETSPTEFPVQQEAAYRETTEVGPEPAQTTETPWWTPAPSTMENVPSVDPVRSADFFSSVGAPVIADEDQNLPDESVTGGLYFCGETRFASLHRVMQGAAEQRLTGTLRLFWNHEPVEVLIQNGQVLLVTTRDPDLYCPEAPVTLTNVDPERIANAKEQQRQNGCPIFITLSNENLIVHEPALQLVQHHGQKLFSQLWTVPRVRFAFQKGEVPAYATQLTPEPDVDQWALATLRLLQVQHPANRSDYPATSIPAYTRDGYERVQKLRLTVAEAQYASQFNGLRSIQQIAKNLRIDLNLARTTLFRFIALEIVECWPASTAARPESKGVFQKLARSIGIGE